MIDCVFCFNVKLIGCPPEISDDDNEFAESESEPFSELKPDDCPLLLLRYIGRRSPIAPSEFFDFVTPSVFFS